MFLVCNEKLSCNYGFAAVGAQYQHGIYKKIRIPNPEAPSQSESRKYRDTSPHKAATTRP